MFVFSFDWTCNKLDIEKYDLRALNSWPKQTTNKIVEKYKYDISDSERTTNKSFWISPKLDVYERGKRTHIFVSCDNIIWKCFLPEKKRFSLIPIQRVYFSKGIYFFEVTNVWEMVNNIRHCLNIGLWCTVWLFIWIEKKTNAKDEYFI